MSAPIFKPQAETSFIYWLSTFTKAEVDGYWAGYFASDHNEFGESVSTREVWEDIGGFYLFLKETPSNWSVFEQDLQKLRPNLAPSDMLRILWIENPNDPPSIWVTKNLQAKASGTGSEIVWTTIRSTGFYLGTYSFSVNGLSELTYIDDTNGGGFGFSSGGGFTGYSIAEITVSFSSSLVGAFVGDISVEENVWNSLGIGLQYASAPPIPSTLNITNEEEYIESDPENINQVRIIHLPIFSDTSVGVGFKISYDPLNPMVNTRTIVEFKDLGENAPEFESYIRTTRGYPVKIQPLEASGKLSNAQFVFGSCPTNMSSGNKNHRYHLCPNGAFKMNVVAPSDSSNNTDNSEEIENYQLLLGLSGIEYVTLGGANSDMIVFQGGNPAYIPTVDPDSTVAPNVSEALTLEATTAHGTIMSSDNDSEVNPGYYAQPKQAPLYSGKGSNPEEEDPILNFNAMKAYTLSSDTSQEISVFPVGIYAGLSTDKSAIAKEMENASLAPYRHYKLGEAYGTLSLPVEKRNTVPTRRTRAEDDPLAVTPQGLVAELNSNYDDFDGLYLGNMPKSVYCKVDLTAVQGQFKEALQSNQLFFVASNVDVLMQGTSVRYQLNEDDEPYLLALDVPQSTVEAAVDAVGGETFETETDFVNAISSIVGNYIDQFLQVCGILKVEMDGWTFQLSPRSWRTDPDSPTLMIAKFCNRSLLDLANDTSSWGWPEVGQSNGGTLKDTQRTLLDLLSPKSEEEDREAYKIFYDDVVNNPAWNGFLFLNAPVDISELPEDLKFLAAGINLDAFYAHHIGFSQTPFEVEGGVPVLKQTAAFGLIDYIDKVDLHSDESIPFGFKTMQLSARFANATLADFSAQVELMVNQMLAASLFKNEPARGNNLIIDGSYQRVGGSPSYAFVLTGQNLFNTNNTALTSIEFLSVQLINSPSDSDEILTTFLLMGNLRFILIEGFDMFSYGIDEDDIDHYLRFSGFAIDMSFSLATPDQQTFVAREASTSFNMSNSSEPRPNSLLNNFPLVVSSLVASPNLALEGEEPAGQTPEEMGYTSVSAPVTQSILTPSWYGLQYVLDLGTLGALTGSNSIKINVLAAWGRKIGQSEPPVYIGLSLPNMPVIGGSFPLQGVLKLGFRNFQFETYTRDDSSLGYNLRLRNFALSILVWSFPPGNTDIILFGEKGNTRGSLGWYAAYAADEDSSSKNAERTKLTSDDATDKNEQKLSRIERRNRSGRRTPPVN